MSTDYRDYKELFYYTCEKCESSHIRLDQTTGGYIIFFCRNCSHAVFSEKTYPLGTGKVLK